MMSVRTIKDRATTKAPGQGALVPITSPPLTPNKHWQAITNDPAGAVGPPWAFEFHGDFAPRCLRMEKNLKCWENGNDNGIVAWLLVLPVAGVRG